MFQEILTYLVLLFIAYILANKGYHFLKRPSDHCEGCFAAKNGCKVAGLKRTSKVEK